MTAVDRLELTAWKGFREYAINFNRTSTTLIGPNNAGKSTLVGALRLAASLIDHASRRNAGDASARRAGRPNAYTVTVADLEAAAFNSENLLHEFRPVAPSMTLTFDDGAQLRLEWQLSPEGAAPPEVGFFTFAGGAAAHSIGVVPTLSPLESSEVLLTDRRIRGNFTTRLASSHFRNQLYWAFERSAHWPDLEGFLLEFTPEIAGLRFDVGPAERGGRAIDVYYREPHTHHDRELIWAGDGLQIWLQILFHIWRERGSKILVLDEPDVYLHPDLQRRLARLCSTADRQVVIATHSLELLAELGPTTAIAVDRSMESAQRLFAKTGVQDAADIIGSGLAFGLARAFTRPLVLCLEGQDKALLNRIAARLGCVRLATEQGVAPVSMAGFSDHERVAGFASMMRELQYTGQVVVLLDRDYRDSRSVAQVIRKFDRVGARCHVWQRKEIENYLLLPSLIARAVELTESVASQLLDQVLESLHDESKDLWQTQRFRLRDRSRDEGKVWAEASASFDAAWSAADERAALVPGKRAISELSRVIQASHRRSISARKLAAAVVPGELPDEIERFIRELEGILGPR